MKLSVDEAVRYIRQAREDVRVSNGELRFGQALWNNIPHAVSNPHLGTVNDFFYWLDEVKILSCFYDNFMEN